MFIAYAVLAVLLSVMLTGSAYAKLSKQPKLVESLAVVGATGNMLRFLALCELAGAVGLIVGLWYAPLGVAAAIGVVAYFVGAVGAHLRVRDWKGAPTAAVILILAAVTLAMRVASR